MTGTFSGARFVHEMSPVRVVFGAGAVSAVGAETSRLELSRVLVVSTPGRAAIAADVAAALGGRLVGVHAEAEPHVPARTAERARVIASEAAADGLVAIGGGSAIGLAKAVALTEGLPILAVPTTFAGSEMTPVWGITSGGVKHTDRDRRALPRTVVYDPVLTRSMPVATAIASGVNAIAHAAEALYAPDVTPIGALLAEEAVRALATALPAIGDGDQDAHAEALYGAWLAGTCLGSTTMGLHHKLCHVLGGAFGLPHALTHAVVLPYVLAHNLPAAPQAARRLGRALGAENPVDGLRALLDRLHTPRSLAELGLDRAAVDRAADLAGRDPYANPRPTGPQVLRSLLNAALSGRPPVTG